MPKEDKSLSRESLAVASLDRLIRVSMLKIDPKRLSAIIAEIDRRCGFDKIAAYYF